MAVMITSIGLFELRRLFLSPFAWTVLAIVQFIHALVFYKFLSSYLQQPEIYNGHGLTEVVVAGYYQSSGLIMLLITPFLTMRLLSEEFRTGTIKLLLSSPVSVSRLVLGKFLGIVLFMISIVIMTGLLPASLLLGAPLDYGQFIGSILGMVLLLATFSATGLFVSSLFKQPVIAAICTFAVLLVLWTSHLASDEQSGNSDSVAAYLSILHHYSNFTEGMFNSVDLVYFIILTVTFLLLGIWRIDAMRTHP